MTVSRELRELGVEGAIAAAAEKYGNRGKWGADDELGTANYITADKIRAAAGLVRKGRVFALAFPFDAHGPQTGQYGRHNPIHTMTLSGADCAAGKVPLPHGIGAADDAVTMPLQCGTQWDSLAHIFDHGQMWNGYPCDSVNWTGAERCGIQVHKDKLVSRGVLLDVAHAKGRETLDDGYAVSEADLLATIESQGASSRVARGDIVIVRTGQLGRCLRDGWGTFAGGPAPGLSFDTVGWLHASEIAAVATDTWGVEVRPNEWDGAFQPLHQVAIPHIGLLLGEMWMVDELAADCAEDRVWEFQLVAQPLPFTGAVGSPVNPIAIK